MSELFKALQRLEEQAEKVPPVPPPSPGRRDGLQLRGIPYLRVLIVVTITLVLGVCGLLFFRYFQQHPDLFMRGTSPASSGEPLPCPSPAPPPAGPEEETLESPSLPPSGKETTLVREPMFSEGSAGVPASLSRGEEAGTEEQLQPAVPLTSGELDALAEKKEVSSGYPEQDRREFHRKRLLYRAEKLRLQGKTVEALTLYKEVWQQQQTPSLANNMGALLLQQHQYPEALQYLRQALKNTPDDRDLLYNLELARRGLASLDSSGKENRSNPTD